MLDIIDINTSAQDLQEVTNLKESFRSYMSKVTNGTVIIINNFPAHEIIKYLVVLNIEKKISNNYHQFRYGDRNYYVDNLICAIVKYEEHNIITIDDNFFYGEENSSYDYHEENKIYNNDLKKFLNNFQEVRCNTILSMSSPSNLTFSSSEVLLNKQISAENIISMVCMQHIKESPEISRIHAFVQNVSALNSSTIQNFIDNIISNNNSKFEYGILTKKKLELISFRKNQIVDDIIEHIGKSINIITGKSGTGKTVYLLKAIYRLIGEKHRARFLTFNNILVKDIKCTLRGYGNFNSSNFSATTIHKYFFKLAKNMGINLILSKKRVDELMQICSYRFDKFKPTYEGIKNGASYTHQFLIDDITSREKDKSNYPEFREIAYYFMTVRDFRDWQKIKDSYLIRKRALLQEHIGSQVFLQDYPKVLETLYLSITDTEKFYTDFNISSRYELLSFVYNVDKHTDEKRIPYESVEKQVLALKRSANWSVMFIDEAQDCEQYEKEILFALRGSENIVVASGGKEQLIRSSGERIWNRSNGKEIAHNITRLYGNSYRQKDNLIRFVNELSKEYAINLQLVSHRSSKGVGKIILDLRKNDFLWDKERIDYLLKYGKLNGCSIYESLMILVTSNYVEFGEKKRNSFKVDVTDHVTEVSTWPDRTLNGEDMLLSSGLSIWNGVAESKSELQVPFHNQARIISYDSCRGLEAWSVMCLDIDNFIKYKRRSDDAKSYLADDLYLSEEERQDKYALIWLLMAFTRPIDTLYLDFRSRKNKISQKIVAICEKLEGVEILR